MQCASSDTCEPGSRMVGHRHHACGVFGDDQIVANDDDDGAI
jgi:hypothetical protein